MNCDWETIGDNLVRCTRCGRALNLAVMDDSSRRGPCPSTAAEPPSTAAPVLPGVAVVIPCHNYGRVLTECLDSVLAQTLQPAEIVVVDDSSSDDTCEVAERYLARGVRYLRCDAGHVFDARRLGIRETTAPLICCLDADDRIPPQYLQAAAERMQTPNVGVVWTDFLNCGDFSGPQELQACNIEQSNYIHAASLCRRVALEVTGIYDGPAPPQEAHEDWFVWRALLRAGWQAAKSPVPLHYRRHSPSRSTNRSAQQPYYDRAALGLETVNLVILASGRRQWWPRLQDWVQNQDWPLSQLRLIVASNADPTFKDGLRIWQSMLPCQSTTFIDCGTGGDLADINRATDAQARADVARIVPQMYNAALRHCSSEYILFVEDDGEPTRDAIPRLMRRMDRNVAAVSAAYRSRYTPNDVHGPPVATTDPDVVEVPWTGFGCLLARRSFLQTTPLHHGGTPPWFDHNIGHWAAATGWKWLVDTSLRCRHQDLE